MTFKIPTIIQGGMGAGVSNWRLARAVSLLGQLGVVAGTALDQILSRRLQDGDKGGHIRRALKHFPFPKIAQRVLDAHYIPGGRPAAKPYRCMPMPTVEKNASSHELCMAANFVEIFLAREGHSGPVGINFLEKIQIPHLPSLYGAMLAGVAVVIVGAGIPMEFPAAIEALGQHKPAAYTLQVTDSSLAEPVRMHFDPADYLEPGDSLRPLSEPAFLPVVSSDTLAAMLKRRIKGKLAGFIIEGPTAGGHNAPPRGRMKLTPGGEPVYGPRDQIRLSKFRELGMPFWLAGGYGSRDGLKNALAEGATGIQVGTLFALCRESGLSPRFRHALIAQSIHKKATVTTDVKASPTGFPFKVAKLDNSLSEPDEYARRERRCDLGFLREIYRKEDGTLGYRCAAENENSYLAKGGQPEKLVGCKCLCNGLIANIGMPQRLSDGTDELPLLTMGDDCTTPAHLCMKNSLDYSASDVIQQILS